MKAFRAQPSGTGSERVAPGVIVLRLARGVQECFKTPVA
jgi:hypothetical protein